MTKHEFLNKMDNDCFYYGYKCEQMGMMGISKNFSEIRRRIKDIQRYWYSSDEVEDGL